MKPRASKLDDHEEALLAWLNPKPEGEGLTLDDALVRLQAQRGLSVSRSRLSSWYSAQRTAELQRQREARLFASLADGSRQAQEIDSFTKKHPAPELGQIAKLLKSLAMQLAVQGVDNPEALEMVNPLIKHLLDFLKIEEKQKDRALDERRVVLLEQKAAKADQAEQVTRSELTPEQKMARYREIFGLAA